MSDLEVGICLCCIVLGVLGFWLRTWRGARGNDVNEWSGIRRVEGIFLIVLMCMLLGL